MDIAYLVLGPFAIILANYIASGRPRSFIGYLDVLLKARPHLYGYLFFLYYLGMERIADTGWAPITLMIVLVPITVLAVLIRVAYMIRRRFYKPGSC